MSKENAKAEEKETAVHRLLRIPEILEEITRYLDQPTLTRAAQVCASFYDASVGRLWSGLKLTSKGGPDQGGNIVRRLRKLLPPDLTQRHLTSDNWDRFKHYSVHAKAILINVDNSYPEVFSALAGLASDFFPRLQTLLASWEVLVGNPEFQWISLASPRLKTIAFGVYDNEAQDPNACIVALHSIFQHIPIHSPHLEQLKCDDLHQRTPLVAEWVKAGTSIAIAMQSLADLRSFSWDSRRPIPKSILLTLSKLPRLSRLHLEGHPPLDKLQWSTGYCFPGLQRLRILGKSEWWFENLTNPQLLTHLDLWSIWDSPSLFRAYNLTHLKIHLIIIAWENLSPLLQCKSIRDCELFVDGVDDINDNVFEAMASSWRELEGLSIVETGSVAHASLLGLVPFAALCPRLRRLHLTMSPTLRSFYGTSWREQYRHSKDQSYASSPLEDLALKLSAPEELGELGEAGLGILGIAILIRRLWPSLEPGQVRKLEPLVPRPWPLVQAVMGTMQFRDLETEELRSVVTEKESQLKAMRIKQELVEEESERLRCRIREMERERSPNWAG